MRSRFVSGDFNDRRILAGKGLMATVVFDLDGTLADTSGDLIAAANSVFEEAGHGPLLHPTRDAATAFRGGRAMLRLGYSRLGREGDEAIVDAGYPVLLKAYDAAISVHTRLYPGAEAAVTKLRALGYRTAICTNKPEALADKLLRNLDVRHHFDALIGADTLTVSKPHPDPFHQSVLRSGGDTRRAILIGDTVTDRDTARAANVPCILVGFGPDGRTVEALEPEALIDHFDELPDAVAVLLPPPD